jgi:HPt (histidine-containing phosphotransfer) domain-containing protein
MPGDDAILQRIRSKFAEDAPASVAAMHEALAEGELERLAEKAHFLASSGHAIQADELAAQAKSLEQAAKRGDPEAASRELEAFEAVLARTLQV